MPKKPLFILIAFFLLLGVALITLIYFQVNLRSLKEEKSDLLSKLASADKEIFQLKSSLKDRETELQKIRKELESLRYPQRLKKALSASQEMINQLSSEINSLKEKIKTLNEERISFKNRAEINAKEVARLLRELQEAKKKMAMLESKGEIFSEGSLSISAGSKESKQTVKELKRQLVKLKEEYQDLLRERNFLKKNIEKYQRELARKRPSKYWEGRIKELSESLKEKEKEKKDLERKISKLKKEKEDLARKLEDQSTKIKELSLLNTKLQEQIVKLTSELSKKSKEYYALEEKLNQPSIDKNELLELQERLKIQRERLRTVTYLYNRLKDQLKQLSDILYSKDSELEKKEKEIAQLKDEISYLKVRAETLEEAFKASEENQRRILERLKQVTDLNTNLQEKLGEVSTLLGEEFSSKRIPLKKRGSSTIPLEEKNIDELKKKVEVILRSIQSQDSLGEDFE